MKKVLAILLVLSFVLTMAVGCTPKVTTGAATPTTTTAAVTAPATTTAAVTTPATTTAQATTTAAGTTAAVTTTAPATTAAPGAEQVLRLSYGNNNFNDYDFVYPWNDVGLVGNLLWLTLIQADNKLKATSPEIMSAWTQSEDGLTYTFTMREDLLWSDGKPITMDDILWTFDRLGEQDYWPYINAALNYVVGREAYRKGEAKTITGISAQGNVLTIELKAPFASFLNLMAQVAPLPKHIYENCKFADNGFKTDPIWETLKVNSGPFVVSEHVKGNYYVLTPNPNYKGEKSKITKIINTKTTDATALVQKGEVDYVGTNSADQYEIFSKLSNYRLETIPIIYFRFLVFNFFDDKGNKKDFVSDLKVRQAFAHAIDWKTVIDGLFGKLANLTQSGVLSGDPNYLGDWYTFDQAKAKALLDEAKFDYNHTIKIFYYYNDQTTADLMDAIAFYLDQIGVKMEGVYTTNSIGDIYEGRTHDIAYFGLSAYDNLSWYQMYLRDNMDKMLESVKTFKDPVSKLEVAITPELWKEALTNLQTIERETVYFLPVYTLNYQVWLNERLSVPAEAFGNNWFFYDYRFEDWQITK